RDLTVTGVQTCALPISLECYRDSSLLRLLSQLPQTTQAGEIGGDRISSMTKDQFLLRSSVVSSWMKDFFSSASHLHTARFAHRRSEERRVGEECGVVGW